jgi:predicted transposase/invertase (TIGR01784 family)
VDRDSRRLLEETLEIHTLELGWYNLKESDLETASLLDRWLYWLLHAHQYDAQTLLRLFPQPEFQKATDSIDRIAKKSEDKTMYDTREKAIRDQQWILNAARRQAREEGREEGCEEGEIKGEIKLIQTLQAILGVPLSDVTAFHGQSLNELRTIAEDLRNKIQRRS